jgi:2-polyprenyl-6-methoxyphenol hydroxylase-like FAD-dependent oxidoreductase
MDVDTEVLIIGAGPSGLTLAVALARYGVGVRIVDRNDGPSIHTKATNLMQRNQELIAALGLLEPLAKQSGQMRRLMVTAYGANVGPRTMRLRESPYTDVLLCGQDRFEAVMLQGLLDLGVAVEWNSTLTGLDQYEGGATAELTHTDGTTESVRAGWVAGCDGAAGTSRGFTANDFTPTRTGVAIRQIDATLTWRRSIDAQQMWLFYFDRGFGVVVPLPGNVHRILTVEPVPAIPNRRPTLTEMQDALQTMAGDPTAVLTDERWTSYTDLAMGIARSLRDQRVFLVGDVGNPVLPNGGQGMNTGIADAYDLAWKLAAHIRHGAPDALLDTYNTERHTLRTALQKAQYSSLKYTTLTTPAPVRAAFRALAEPVLNHGAEYRVAQAFSELNLNTRKSPLSLDRGPHAGLRAGDRALDVPVNLDGAPRHMYDLIYRGSWTLLAFSGRGRRADAARSAAALAELSTVFPSYLVSTTARTEHSGSTLWDLDGEAHRTYGFTSPQLVLIRPDGHIAVRVALRRKSELADYIHTWSVDSTQEFSPLEPKQDNAQAPAATF